MFVSHLESALDGTRLPSGQLQTTHKDRPLWVRYDLDAVAKAVTKKTLGERAPGMWRYREFLPVPNDAEVISLGEVSSPLLKTVDLGETLGASDLWIKDESVLPTASFKSRGMAVAVTMAKSFGIKRIALPTAGNAGGAAAAYAAKAGIEAFVFMPHDTPDANQFETQLYGAHTYLVNGLITDCGHIVREGQKFMNWFDLSTLREPYRIEGKKTMGLELAEQFQWKLPDVILYPTGGGTGLIGMWKAFLELKEIGWLESDVMPRMVAVQSDGCCPIVRAFEKGEKFAEPFADANTAAAGIRVPAAIGDFMMLDVLRQSNGRAVAVEEHRLIDWMKLASRQTGVAVCLETAACVGALAKLTKDGWVNDEERVLILNTASGLKSVGTLPDEVPLLDKNNPIDWKSLQRAISERN